MAPQPTVGAGFPHAFAWKSMAALRSLSSGSSGDALHGRPSECLVRDGGAPSARRQQLLPLAPRQLLSAAARARLEPWRSKIRQGRSRWWLTRSCSGWSSSGAVVARNPARPLPVVAPVQLLWLEVAAVLLLLLPAVLSLAGRTRWRRGTNREDDERVPHVNVYLKCFGALI